MAKNSKYTVKIELEDGSILEHTATSLCAARRIVRDTHDRWSWIIRNGLQAIDVGQKIIVRD